MSKIKNINNLEAVGDNVLVKVIKNKKETNAGIALPDSADDKETVVFCKVVSVQDIDIEFREDIGLPDSMKYLSMMGLEHGDTVVCKKFEYIIVNADIDGDDNEYRLYSANGIVGVIRK